MALPFPALVCLCPWYLLPVLKPCSAHCVHFCAMQYDDHSELSYAQIAEGLRGLGALSALILTYGVQSCTRPCVYKYVHVESCSELDVNWIASLRSSV